jgi:hypothetical protein
MWFPGPRQSRGIEEKNLMAGLSILVSNPQIIVVFPFPQDRVDTRKVWQKNHLLDPVMRELTAAIEAHPACLVLFRETKELPLVLEQERVGEVMGCLENRLDLGRAVEGASGDVPLFGFPHVIFEEDPGLAGVAHQEGVGIEMPGGWVNPVGGATGIPPVALTPS